MALHKDTSSVGLNSKKFEGNVELRSSTEITTRIWRRMSLMLSTCTTSYQDTKPPQKTKTQIIHAVRDKQDSKQPNVT